MPTDTTLRPSSAIAVSTTQVIRRRSFGKVVRVVLVGHAPALAIPISVPDEDGGHPSAS